MAAEMNVLVPSSWVFMTQTWKSNPLDPRLVGLFKAFLGLLTSDTFTPDLNSVSLETVGQAMSLCSVEDPFTATLSDFSAVLALFSSVPVGENPTGENTQLFVARDDAGAVSQAFDSTRYANSEAVTLLLEHLWLCAAKWSGAFTIFYAPYLALINASMTGKSRLVAELRKHGVFLLLVCLRAEEDENYRPPRTPRITEWATKKGAVEPARFTAEVCAFLAAFIRELAAFLAARRQSAATSVVSLAEDWFQAVYGAEADEAIWGRIADAVNTVTVNFKTGPSCDKVIGSWKRKLMRLYAELRLTLVSLVGAAACDKWMQTQVNYVFVVDETRQLNVASETSDRFALFRRALRCLPFNEKRGTGFCLVTDTTSTIANLAPTKRLDASFRVSSAGKLLFPPFTLVDTVDAWWHEAKKTDVHIPRHLLPLATTTPPTAEDLGAACAAVLEHLRTHLVDEPVAGDGDAAGRASVPLFSRELGASALFVRLLTSFEFMAMFGRPAYYGFLRFRGEVEASAGFAALEILLQAKLLRQHPLLPEATEDVDEELQADFGLASDLNGGLSAPPLPLGFSQTQVLAVLGTLAALHISAASHMASELVSGHMRLVAAISKQRKYVYTLEVSEPLMAFAAHSLILGGRLPWHVVIDKYTACVLNDTTSVGFRGEVAAQILCLVAWQKCLPLTRVVETRQLPEFGFPFVPAVQFLKNLLGTSIYAQISAEIRTRLEADLSEAFVRVNQFVKTFTELEVDTLFEYALRASGVYCREGQKAIDLALPLWVDRGSGLTPLSVSAILLQIKLRKDALDKGELQAWFFKLDALPVLDQIPSELPTVAICLNLGPAIGAEALVEDFQVTSTSTPGTRNSRIVKLPRVQAFLRPELQFEAGARPAKFAYAFVCEGVSMASVSPEDTAAVEAFDRLLESTADPSVSLNVELLHRRSIKTVFRTQPYMTSRQPKRPLSNI